MELTQHGLLEELLAPRRDSWTTIPTGVNEFFPSTWCFESFDESPDLATLNPSFVGLTPLPELTSACPFNEVYPFFDGFTVSEIDNSKPISIQEAYRPMVEDGGLDFLGCNHFQSLEQESKSNCKVEMEQAKINMPVSTMGFCGEKKSKKVEGQPSKNLMAERRRRKRLNDRLSMLRSIVPKISKMDRTSILGDTIDYMKELLEKINKLQEEDMGGDFNQMNIMRRSFKELKPNDILVRNPPKFDVERRDMDTRIEICCAAKPGLLLSTVNTLEAIGLDIQQCVISCFNDFSLQASCSEVLEHRTIINSEDIKQELFRNAGYGGRCL